MAGKRAVVCALGEPRATPGWTDSYPGRSEKALQRAVEVDEDSPAGAIELGHYLDAVEDNPRAAVRAFSEGVAAARRLLIDGLLGQAKALVQLKKREEALRCLIESVQLISSDPVADNGKSTGHTPDLLLRDATGRILTFQLKGPFAMKIEELLEEVSPKRSA